MKKLLLLCAYLSFALMGYSQAGTIDSSFADKGWTYMDYKTAISVIGKQVLARSDGTFMILFSNKLASYLNNGGLDISYGTEGYSETLKFAGEVAALQADGKIIVAGNANNGFALARYNSDGRLDNTFGSGGVTYTSFPGFNALISVIAVHTDGKIAVGGEVTASSGSNKDFALVRYLPDGTPDINFGESGKVITDIGISDNVAAISFYPDGRLIVAGNTYIPNTGSYRDFAVLRYKINGSLDETFNGSGKAITDFFHATDQATCMGLLSDGRIIVAGMAYNIFTDSDDIALARYNVNGTMDRSFGEGGKVTTDYWNGYESVVSIIVRGDGSSTVVGTVENHKTHDADFAFASYNRIGHLEGGVGEIGIITTDFGNFETASSMVIQKDGKMIIAGTSYNLNTDRTDFILVRYADGIDKTFGGNGKLVVYEILTFSISQVKDIASQEDGKIIVAGWAFSPWGYNFVIARYNQEGTLDPDFGEYGSISTGISDFIHVSAASILLQSDKKILVTAGEFTILRYNSDGTPDKTFGEGGRVTIGYGSFKRVSSLALQNDGKIVVAAANEDGFFVIARINEDGSLDTNFGVDGIVATDLYTSVSANPSDYPRRTSSCSILIQSDGKIVLAGTMYSNFAIARYNENGSLDKSFGIDGITTTDFRRSSDFATSVALQSNGKIIAAGWSGHPRFYNEHDFAVARYNTNGSLDNTFSEDGKDMIDFANDFDEASSIAIQWDGKIIISGTATYNYESEGVFRQDQDFAAVRYNIDGTLDPTFGKDGKLTTDSEKEYNLVSTSKIYNNRLYVAGASYTLGNHDAEKGILAAYKLNGCTQQVFYNDKDKDGYGNPEQSIQACTATEGYVALAGDCNDNNAAIHPGSDNFPNSWLFNNTYSIGIYNNPLTPGCSDDHGLISAPVTGSGGHLYVTTSPAATYSVATRALQLQFDLYAFDAGTDLTCATPLVAFKCTTKVKVYIVAGTHTSSARPAAADIYGQTSWITLSPGSNRISVPVTKPLVAGALYRLYVEGENEPCNNMKDQRYVLDHITVESGVMQESFTGTMPPAGWQISTMVKTGVYNSMATPACADDRGLVSTQVGAGGPAYLASTPAVALSGAATALKVTFDLYAFKLNDQLDCAVMQAALKCSTQLKLYLVPGNYNATTPPTDAYTYGATGWITLHQQANAIIVPITRVLVPGTAYRLYIEVVNSNCANLPAQRYVIDNISMAEVQNTMGGEICGNGIDENCNGLADEACSPASTKLQVQAGAKAMESSSGLQVKAVPNPSNSYFTLQLQGRADVPLSIKVLDVTGRVLEVKTGLSSNTTLQLGQHYRPGIYLVELTQGKEKVFLKLVKQAD